jgi:hypothetical protein
LKTKTVLTKNSETEIDFSLMSSIKLDEYNILSNLNKALQNSRSRNIIHLKRTGNTTQVKESTSLQSQKRGNHSMTHKQLNWLVPVLVMAGSIYANTARSAEFPSILQMRPDTAQITANIAQLGTPDGSLAGITPPDQHPYSGETCRVYQEKDSSMTVILPLCAVPLYPDGKTRPGNDIIVHVDPEGRTRIQAKQPAINPRNPDNVFLAGSPYHQFKIKASRNILHLDANHLQTQLRMFKDADLDAVHHMYQDQGWKSTEFALRPPSSPELAQKWLRSIVLHNPGRARVVSLTKKGPNVIAIEFAYMELSGKTLTEGWSGIVALGEDQHPALARVLSDLATRQGLPYLKRSQSNQRVLAIASSKNPDVHCNLPTLYTDHPQ